MLVFLNLMKKLLSYILIVFTLGLLFNNSVNWHFHQLPNGIVVEHAHPYSKGTSSGDSPYEKHHHSNLEYLILDMVFYSGWLVILAFSGFHIFSGIISRILFLVPNSEITSGNFHLPLLRAPPST